MANELFIPKARSANKLASEAVESGSLIVVSDACEIYADLSGARIKITDLVTLATDAARTALLAPLNKLYYVAATRKLWWHDTAWRCLNPDSAAVTLDAVSLFGSDIDPPQPLGKYIRQADGIYLNTTGCQIRTTIDGCWEIYDSEFGMVLWNSSGQICEHPWQVATWTLDPSGYASGTPTVIQL